MAIPLRSARRNFRPDHRGLTLFELVVVVCVVGVLAAIYFDRLLAYQERAEKSAMEQVAAAVRSALYLRVAAYLARGRTPQDLSELTRQNPMDWLAEKPASYIGMYYGAPEGEATSGAWYFDAADKSLVYVPKRTRYFEPEDRDRHEIRFKARVNYGILPGEEGKERPIEGLRQFGLDVVTPYLWFEEPGGHPAS
jgi:prepilin-type N-terminal cleavage/methylation domain-containing protein